MWIGFVLDRHHYELCEKLQNHYAAAGGPISVPEFLHAAMPTIQPLLDHNIAWKWIGARVLAIHSEPDVMPEPQMADLPPTAVKTLVGAYSRKKTKALAAQALPETQSASAIGVNRADARPPIAAVTGPALSGADPPGSMDARARIATSREIAKQLGTMET